MKFISSLLMTAISPMIFASSDLSSNKDASELLSGVRFEFVKEIFAAEGTKYIYFQNGNTIVSDIKDERFRDSERPYCRLRKLFETETVIKPGTTITLSFSKVREVVNLYYVGGSRGEVSYLGMIDPKNPALVYGDIECSKYDNSKNKYSTLSVKELVQTLSKHFKIQLPNSITR
ncbi:MAG: hypothetical protein ACOVP4_02115 [Bacteriovoracaceae bacterium]